MQIAGFVNAIKPVDDDQENLLAFRFQAVNSIVDPWVFIIFRKSVFRHVRSFLCCRFSRRPMNTMAHCTLSLPPEVNKESPNTSPSIALQPKLFSNLPL
ncbi:hypothetical protein UPYG_G00196570 [Umbra pygmaea]|uniref:Uncharacterized protein n=1 Tax=Umbra pygmaea TaxID=75934 RepID=A0ABD0WIX1_UMBPY